MIFLPPNPCCTPTPPPSPCGGYGGCDPCNASPIPTNNVSYSGPNLPCTQIKTCDTVTVAFQKVDAQICLLKQQISILQASLNNCCPTTTSTTTTVVPTTTTTTTIACPSCTFYSVTNSTVSSVDIVYYACGGIYIQTCVAGPSTIYVCACTGSVVVPPIPGVTLSTLGACPTTTTTTTTTPPTTTTTTTAVPPTTTTTTTTLIPPTTTTTTTLFPPTTTTTTTLVPPTTTTTTTLIPPTTTTTTTLEPPTTTTTTTLEPPTTTTTTTLEPPVTTTTTTTVAFCITSGFPEDAYAALFWSQGEVDTTTNVTCDGGPVPEPSQSKSVWIAFFSDAGLTTPLGVTLNNYSVTVGGTPYSIGAGTTEYAYFIDYFPYSSNPLDPITCIPGETVFVPLPTLSANTCFTVVTSPTLGDGDMIIQRGAGDPTTNDYSADLANCLYSPGTGTLIEVVINTGQAGPITQSNIAGYCNITIRQLVLAQAYTITIVGTANDGSSGETITVPFAIATSVNSVKNYFLDSNHSITVTVDETP